MFMQRRGGHDGPMGAMRQGERALNFKANMVKLVQYLHEYRLKLITVAIFAVASTVFNIYSQAGAGFAEHVNDR